LKQEYITATKCKNLWRASSGDASGGVLSSTERQEPWNEQRRSLNGGSKPFGQARRWSNERQGLKGHSRNTERQQGTGQVTGSKNIEVQRYVISVSGAMHKAAKGYPPISYHHAMPSKDHCSIGLFHQRINHSKPTMSGS
jgi:hypothetical protein